MAGPCAVEGFEQVDATAHNMKVVGAHIFRGRAFKPCIPPYSLRGSQEDSLRMLCDTDQTLQLLIITECMAPENVDLVLPYADVIQIGARNVQNLSLPERSGQIKTPVLLKRDISTPIEEWQLATEYILEAENHNFILRKRRIRTFETATHNTLDLSAVLGLHKRTCHS